MKYVCEFCGGPMNRIILPLEEAEKMTDRRSEDLSQIRNMGGLCRRSELDNKPVFEGYLGPMWDGEEDGVATLRYETQEVYDMLSN